MDRKRRIVLTLCKYIILPILSGFAASILFFLIIRSHMPNIYIGSKIYKRQNVSKKIGYDYFIVIYNKGTRKAINLELEANLVAYPSTNVNWKMFFKNKGQTPQSIEVPLAADKLFYLVSRTRDSTNIKLLIDTSPWFHRVLERKLADADSFAPFRELMRKDSLTLDTLFAVFDSLQFSVLAQDEYSGYSKIFERLFSKNDIISYPIIDD